jgi:hypothetical protein
MPNIRSLLWGVLGAVRQFAVGAGAQLKVYKVVVHAEVLPKIHSDTLPRVFPEALMKIFSNPLVSVQGRKIPEAE